MFPVATRKNNQRNNAVYAANNAITDLATSFVSMLQFAKDAGLNPVGKLHNVIEWQSSDDNISLSITRSLSESHVIVFMCRRHYGDSMCLMYSNGVWTKEWAKDGMPMHTPIDGKRPFSLSLNDFPYTNQVSAKEWRKLTGILRKLYRFQHSDMEAEINLHK